MSTKSIIKCNIIFLNFSFAIIILEDKVLQQVLNRKKKKLPIKLFFFNSKKFLKNDHGLRFLHICQWNQLSINITTKFPKTSKKWNVNIPRKGKAPQVSVVGTNCKKMLEKPLSLFDTWVLIMSLMIFN